MSDAPRKRKAGSPLPRDLSELAGPSDTGFLAPRPEGAALAALALTEAEVERFTKDGYIATSKPVLTPAQLEQLRADLDELVCPEPPHPRVDLMHELHYNEAEGSGSVLFHGLGHWRCAASFHDLLYLDAVALPASQLLQGRPVRFWHDQAFVKPSGEGAVVQWHQDFSYWDRTGPMAHLTVHIALDDQTLENGALHWVPGSHRWTRGKGGPLPQAAAIAREKMERAKARARPLRPRPEARGVSVDVRYLPPLPAAAKAGGGGADLAAASFDTNMDALYDSVLTDEERAQWAARPPETVLLKAGHAAFHHALCVHGSWGNRSAAPRRALVLNYFAHGTRSLMEGSLMQGLPAVTKGQTLGGRFHPVVFDTTRIDMSALPVAGV